MHNEPGFVLILGVHNMHNWGLFLSWGLNSQIIAKVGMIIIINAHVCILMHHDDQD
jgi:hypothetical protein